MIFVWIEYWHFNYFQSDELKERLMKLQEIADAKTYNELVKDVAWNQRGEPEYFSSYKEQLGFGTLNFLCWNHTL